MVNDSPWIPRMDDERARRLEDLERALDDRDREVVSLRTDLAAAEIIVEERDLEILALRRELEETRESRREAFRMISRARSR